MKTKKLTRADKERLGMSPPSVSKYDAKRRLERSGSSATLADTLTPEVRAKLEAMSNG